MDMQEAHEMMKLSVKLGIMEYKLKEAYDALRRAGVELYDVSGIDEQPGTSYAIGHVEERSVQAPSFARSAVIDNGGYCSVCTGVWPSRYARDKAHLDGRKHEPLPKGDVL